MAEMKLEVGEADQVKIYIEKVVANNVARADLYDPVHDPHVYSFIRHEFKSPDVQKNLIDYVNLCAARYKASGYICEFSNEYYNAEKFMKSPLEEIMKKIDRYKKSQTERDLIFDEIICLRDKITNSISTDEKSEISKTTFDILVSVDSNIYNYLRKK